IDSCFFLLQFLNALGDNQFAFRLERAHGACEEKRKGNNLDGDQDQVRVILDKDDRKQKNEQSLRKRIEYGDGCKSQQPLLTFQRAPEQRGTRAAHSFLDDLFIIIRDRGGDKRADKCHCEPGGRFLQKVHLNREHHREHDIEQIVNNVNGPADKRERMRNDLRPNVENQNQAAEDVRHVLEFEFTQYGRRKIHQRKEHDANHDADEREFNRNHNAAQILFRALAQWWVHEYSFCLRLATIIAQIARKSFLGVKLRHELAQSRQAPNHTMIRRLRTEHCRFNLGLCCAALRHLLQCVLGERNWFGHLAFVRLVLLASRVAAPLAIPPTSRVRFSPRRFCIREFSPAGPAHQSSTYSPPLRRNGTAQRPRPARLFRSRARVIQRCRAGKTRARARRLRTARAARRRD